MDLRLIETGNGGDLVFTGKDLKVINDWESMVYMAMFGGNVDQSTPTRRLESEQAFDFWGNSLLEPNSPEAQFNSLTERTLENVALNSAGRIRIEQAVKKDLKFMSAFAEVTVSVSIVGLDEVEIFVKVQKPDNLEEKEFIYIWDSLEGRLVTGNIESTYFIPKAFSDGFSDGFN